MATNFSPCKGSYALNQFPSNVMFGMNRFHVSASGAIQGHHGPLVFSSPEHNMLKGSFKGVLHIVQTGWGSKGVLTHYHTMTTFDALEKKAI